MYLEKYMLLEEDMETTFENKFISTPEVAKQLYRYWYFGRPLFIAAHAVMLLNLLSGILGIILHIINPDIPFINTPDRIIPVCSFILIIEGLWIFSYFAQIKNYEKRSLELGRTEVECTVNIDNAGIRSQESLGSSSSVSFDKVQSAFTTKDYIYIVTRAKLIFMLKKDSFTLGDTSGLLNFLRMKGVKVSGK